MLQCPHKLVKAFASVKCDDLMSRRFFPWRSARLAPFAMHGWRSPDPVRDRTRFFWCDAYSRVTDHRLFTSAIYGQ
jgi:hypothetical protein